VALVAGKSRVPNPAAGMTACGFLLGCDGHLESRQVQIALKDLDDRLLVSFGTADELRPSVTLGTDALAAKMCDLRGS